ncbi:MAG TPA: hypothetical protein VFN97_12660 [Actinospica sp.]|nr:hypothetical protein [Actinospica sp.]
MQTSRSDEWPSLLPVAPRLRQAALFFVLAPLLAIIGLILIEHFATSPGDSGSSYNNGNGYPYAPYSSTTTDYGYTDTPTDNGFGDTATATDTSGYGDTSSATTTDTSSPTSSYSPSPTDSGPMGTVEAYFDAIDAGDYQLAWQLGGVNSGQTYDQFVASFSNTQSDIVSPQYVNGDVVTANLVADNKDGTTQYFSGQYTVTNGVITNFNVQQTSG